MAVVKLVKGCSRSGPFETVRELRWGTVMMMMMMTTVPGFCIL